MTKRAETISFDQNSILATAFDRLSSSKLIKTSTGRDETARREITSCLETARACVAGLCNPMSSYISIDATPSENGVTIADTRIENQRMLEALRGDSCIFAYLITCGYDSREALRKLNHDYALYHFQHLIAQQILYSLGAHVHEVIRENSPDFQFFRCAIRMRATPSESGLEDDDTGERLIWDAGAVRQLLQVFINNSLGVQVTHQGSFTPLHSIVGLAMGTRETKRADSEFKPISSDSRSPAIDTRRMLP